MFRYRLGILGLALLLVACQVPVTPAKSTVKKPSASSKPSLKPTQNPEGNFRLQGVLSAPAHLIGNNGGGVVSNNGGSFRVLTAVEERAYVGATVRLLNAANEPVKDASGKPLEALTDAQGRYHFEAALPNQNLILVASLPEGKGALRAVVPKEAPEKQVVNAGLISTLATGYILERYVKGQDDPLATLDRLPPQVEADTRMATRQALAGGTAAVPPALTLEHVVTLVDTLREENPALKQQFEIVKELLIVAGQKDLGAGQLATEVALPGVLATFPHADGTVDFVCHVVGRIFRLGTDGRLTVMAGTAGAGVKTSVDGLKATEAAFGSFVAALEDDARRLLLTQPYRALRLRADGTVEEIWPYSEAATLYLVTPSTGDGVYVLASSGLWEVTPDKQRRLVRTFAAEELAALAKAATFGRDSEGGIHFVAKERSTAYRDVAWRFDPGLTTLSKVTDIVEANATGLMMDPSGHLFLHKVTGALEVKKPDGTTTVFPGDWGTPYNMKYTNFTFMGDDQALMIHSRMVYRVQNGTRTLIAGTKETVLDSQDQISLSDPTGIVALPGSELLVASYNRHQIFSLTPGQAPVALAGNGTQEGPFNGPNLSVELQNPIGIKRHSNGDLYAITAFNRLIRLGADGNATVRHNAKGSVFWLMGLVVAPNGDVFVTGGRHTGDVVTAGFVRRYPADGTAHQVVFEEAETAIPTLHYLAVDPEGQVWAMSMGKLKTWSPEDGFSVVKEDARFVTRTSHKSILDRAAIDKKGRFYFINPEGTGVDRYDPATGAFEAIAGANSPHFSGVDVEESLLRAVSMTFNEAGDLLICARSHNQIKRVPASGLAY